MTSRTRKIGGEIEEQQMGNRKIIFRIWSNSSIIRMIKASSEGHPNPLSIT